MNDPLNDLYKIMDDAGLNLGGLYNTKKSMTKLVNDIRTEIATKTAEYIKENYERKDNA